MRWGEAKRISSQQITLIGMDFTPSHVYRNFLQEIVQDAQVLVGGTRYLDGFPEFSGHKLILRSDISGVLEQITSRYQEGEKIVVLASGDPLFFGIGRRLIQKLGSDAVAVIPAVSSLQWAFAKLGDSWDDAVVETLHGRSIKGLAQRIDGQSKVALLTDRVNTPDRVAQYLIDFEMLEYEMFVAENLGDANEQCRHFTLEEAVRTSFSPLNVIILRGSRPRLEGEPEGIGIPDDFFAQRKPSKGLITKREIRVFSLSELALREDSVLWDIGAATGSIAIEAARIARKGRVYAIEKNEADMDILQTNIRRFRTDVTTVNAKAPHGMDDWEAPDSVFIGGSGGELPEIVRLCASRLRPHGRIVLNAATLETLQLGRQLMQSENLLVDVTQLSVARSKPILDMTRLEALNPVFIVTGRKMGG